jgi:branched-chain amino acid transport system permease protein
MTPKSARRRFTPFYVSLAILVVLLIVGPFVLYPVFLMKALCFALFACAFNLLFGFVGLMSFGHAAFFGAGSYMAAWSISVLKAPPELALLLAAIMGALVGVVFGVMSIRLKAMSFAMVTLALSQMLYFFCVQSKFTGGENGLINSTRGTLFGVFSLESDMTSYIFVAVVFLACFLLIARVVHSPFGQLLKAIRDNEARVLSLGYNVDRYKLIAFILSATIAAVAGGLKAIALGLATLTDVHFGTSGEVVLMTLVGGIGTLFGPVVGAIVTTSMWNYLAQFGSWVTFVQGAIFVACVLMFQRGIVGEIAARSGFRR